MSSLRATFFLVISNWRRLFFSVTSVGCRSRATRARRRTDESAALSTPVITAPSGVTAVNLYRLAMGRRTFRLRHVDAADDLGDRGHVVADKIDCLLAEGAH